MRYRKRPSACVGVELGGKLIVESTTTTEGDVRKRGLIGAIGLAACSITCEAPYRDRTVVTVDEVVSDTVVKAYREGRNSDARVVRAEADTSVDSRGTLVEYFLSVSDAEAT